MANWDCIRSTVYLYTGALSDDATAKQWEDAGFEVGLHVNTGCADWTATSLADDFTTQKADFFSRYPSLAPLATHRTHCIAWSDWATQPKVELQNGIRLDTNYYYWPPDWVNNTPGFFTGSGMPMRFADLDGTMIDVYQATTQMTDESGQSYPYTINTLLDRAIGTQGYYGAFVANIHTDGSTEDQAAAIVTSAKARGVPVVSAKQMLTWLDGRDGSSFTGISWSGGVLTFGVAVGAGANGLQAMVPMQGGASSLSALTRDGVPVSYTTQTIKGISYAFFTAQPGTHEAVLRRRVVHPHRHHAHERDDHRHRHQLRHRRHRLHRDLRLRNRGRPHRDPERELQLRRLDRRLHRQRRLQRHHDRRPDRRGHLHDPAASPSPSPRPPTARSPPPGSPAARAAPTAPRPTTTEPSSR